ncbi:signal peptide peptidase SppA [Altererythrobacter arenosus]|uniref:Signal peptide peptidase SppA n=1 Tax=Altererythrobacter arenosus TaxID=3032592 RepID=A0ABY8FTI2_9SPHN|nr:signal peptide peptidase SppA [Altererythrobacter sp. CAU 1644]WFL78137.1 signal peptide peptidase SppA [Altererythrobacter sp. CAU 1644]
MSFAGKIWRLLVGIKDGLALLFLLLFFALLFAILSARPSPGLVRDGALLLELDGYVVEERSEVDPLQALLAQEAPVGEYPVHELVAALEAAATDDRIKAVAIDLTRFLGGGQVHLQEVGEAMDRVRGANKPVLTYAVGYMDDGMMLAAHASEVWLDPMGGAMIAGPGGSNLYYGELIEKLGINAHVYKVGTYKSAVEPYSRNSMSEESRENYTSLYGALWEEWQANVKKARPALDLARVTGQPAEWVAAAKGDLAQAALSAKLVDKLGSRIDFGKRMAELAGKDDWDDAPGSYASTGLKPFLADIGDKKPGKAIGVVTVAGDIVDGDAGPGSAGGDRIAQLLDDALDDDLAALVVRVDSPGGSVLASEEIRRAIMRHKANDIPVAISFANVAASGGYWVATAGDQIFAQPETITGSIGVFAVIPTFEQTAAKIGVNPDGFRTTPLSGQPDLVAGFTPEVDTILQGSVDNIYTKFVAYVAKARGMTPARVDEVAQGRVWDGGSARQLGLVSQFGGLDDAAEWAAKEAGLKEGDWHLVRLGSSADPYETLIRRMLSDDAKQAHKAGADLFGVIAQGQQEFSARLALDLDRLLGARGVQAYCLECPKSGRVAAPAQGGVGSSWLESVLGFFAK